MCSSVFSILSGSPRFSHWPPTKNAISSSKSISLHGPNFGGSLSTGLVWPFGLLTGVLSTEKVGIRKGTN